LDAGEVGSRHVLVTAASVIVEASADDLVDGVIEVLSAEDLGQCSPVEVDLGILHDDSLVQLAKYQRQVVGDETKLGYLVVELLALDGEYVGVGRCSHGAILDPPGSAVQLRMWETLGPAVSPAWVG
tara:strand:- start:90 stop:470 length:381 start_codon:yes stop_codon:yes gene_type:complete